MIKKVIKYHDNEGCLTYKNIEHIFVCNLEGNINIIATVLSDRWNKKLFNKSESFLEFDYIIGDKFYKTISEANIKLENLMELSVDSNIIATKDF